MAILITRPEPAASELVARLRHHHIAAWSLPLLRFNPGKDLTVLSEKFATLSTGDLIFVLSQQAVRFAHAALTEKGISWPRQTAYYAVGHRTAQALRHACGHDVRYPCQEATSEGLIQIASLHTLANKRALILCGDSGRQLLKKTLTARGAEVLCCQCYQRHYLQPDQTELTIVSRHRHIDTIVVTSAEILKHLFTLFSPADRQAWLLRCRLVVVSQRLAVLATTLGWQNIVTTQGADNDTLLYALLNF